MNHTLLFKLLALALFFCGTGLAAATGLFAQKMAGQTIATAAMTEQSVHTTVGGRLEPCRRIVHKTTIEGLVSRVFVREGDYVTRGQPLFQIDRNNPGDTYLPVLVKSRLKGTVSAILIDLHEEVGSGAPAITVADTQTLCLKAVASDLDAFAIQKGIQVTGLSPAGQSLGGELTSISTEPDYKTGLFTLTFRFTAAPGFSIGMSLFINLPVTIVRGVFVPPEAALRRYGTYQIWVIDQDDTLQSVEVITGPVIEGLIQIMDGLAPGQRYISRPNGREKPGLALRDYLEGGQNQRRPP